MALITFVRTPCSTASMTGIDPACRDQWPIKTYNAALSGFADNAVVNEGSTLYDIDMYAWAMRNAGLLRAGRVEEADLEHQVLDSEFWPE